MQDIIIEIAAEIVECSEGDADLVLCCAVPVNVLLMLIASRVGWSRQSRLKSLSAVLLNALCIGLYSIHCVLFCKHDRIWAAPHDAWTAPVTVTLKGGPTSQMLIRSTKLSALLNLSNQVMLHSSYQIEIVYLLKSFK